MRNYDHRRDWILARLHELADIFAVRVHGFAAMSNHLHLVLEFNPAWLEASSDRQIAERWLQLYCPAHFSKIQRKERIETWLLNPDKLVNMRLRLASVSEFMKCLSEPIARRANREDGCTGRFWEGRFKCQRLLDEAALLSAMVYVDLNPVRAGAAADLEHSDYTSIQQRIRRTLSQPGSDQAWLPPVAGHSGNRSIPLTTRQYLTLVDWTGRRLHSTKRGWIDPQRPPILDRLCLSDHRWARQVQATESGFFRVIGAAEALVDYAQQIRQQWVCGLGTARALGEARPG